MLHTVTVQGFGTYLLCGDHWAALVRIAPPDTTLPALLARDDDHNCDACKKKGLDYAYILVHKRAKEGK